MAHFTPRVIAMWLKLPDRIVPVGSKDWFHWLKHEGRAFRYEQHFTARRERRVNQAYWYAYARHNGRLYKRYIGTSGMLTLVRLDEVAKELNARRDA